MDSSRNQESARSYKSSRTPEYSYRSSLDTARSTVRSRSSVDLCKTGRSVMTDTVRTSRSSTLNKLGTLDRRNQPRKLYPVWTKVTQEAEERPAMVRGGYGHLTTPLMKTAVSREAPNFFQIPEVKHPVAVETGPWEFITQRPSNIKTAGKPGRSSIDAPDWFHVESLRGAVLNKALGTTEEKAYAEQKYTKLILGSELLCRVDARNSKKATGDSASKVARWNPILGE